MCQGDWPISLLEIALTKVKLPTPAIAYLSTHLSRPFAALGTFIQPVAAADAAAVARARAAPGPPA